MKWSPEEKAIARDMYYRGCLLQQIADKLGRSLPSVKSFIKLSDMEKRENNSLPQKRLQTSRLTKPTPENTTIEYEFTEYEMPPDALMIPFVDLKQTQCSFMSGGFWDEPTPYTKCCGLPKLNKKTGNKKTNYCEYHYKISIEEVK